MYPPNLMNIGSLQQPPQFPGIAGKPPAQPVGPARPVMPGGVLPGMWGGNPPGPVPGGPFQPQRPVAPIGPTFPVRGVNNLVPYANMMRPY